ncbi:hypothetical protein EAG11_06095 [Flavobacterium sp. 140616W15]|nr:hypothetical protein EAG11_06095 [Flavobacterium sp. 140616W15]
MVTFLNPISLAHDSKSVPAKSKVSPNSISLLREIVKPKTFFLRYIVNNSFYNNKAPLFARVLQLF